MKRDDNRGTPDAPLPRRLTRTPGASQYTGYAESTLEKLRVSGGGPRFIRLGSRTIAYDYADLDAWLDGMKRATSTSAYDNSGQNRRDA